MVSSSPLVRNVSLPARSQQQQLPSSSQEEEEEQGRAQQRNNNDDENTQKKRTTLERAKSVDASKGLGVALDELVSRFSSFRSSKESQEGGKEGDEASKGAEMPNERAVLLASLAPEISMQSQGIYPRPSFTPIF